MCKVTMQLLWRDQAQKWTYGQEKKPYGPVRIILIQLSIFKYGTLRWHMAEERPKLITSANILPPVQKGKELQK